MGYVALKEVMDMAKLGRPALKKIKTASFRVSEQEWADLRRCAIAEDVTMVEWLRHQIKKCRRYHKTKGDWPEEIDRE